MDVDFGVEVGASAPFVPEGSVRVVTTPGGRVVGATHVGPYGELRAAHDAIHAWAAERGLRFGGASWEIYGDPTPDPAKTETRVEYLLAPCITIVVAVAENGVIGNAGKIPWHLSEDLKRFKRLTMGHPIVMGRKTWESIGRALPGRENVVITRQKSYQAPGAVVVGSLREALATRPDAFVIGGGEIYKEALAIAQRIELTKVLAPYDGDATFPQLGKEWREVAREAHPEGSPPYEFVTLVRDA